ncbi:hypothetical protein MKD41_00275 [Lutibacter sp. A64]|uniref:hypothetical protein n=1 Tax=Lutibacter sp. A64 TaxID=2918526 RepID=UPI001F06996F|nr:hypothetical protein [Lutibacter sp. A64]UMB53933.1 hypothetical protein MKD41_00275 [Lutibacter sp. A64]
MISQLVIAQTKQINLTSGTVKVPAMQYKQFTFSFAEGDKIVFNFKEQQNKIINKVEIFELPSNLKFSDFKTKNITNKVITVNQEGIYLFRITNASLGKRICNISVDRVPKDISTINFNSTVAKRIISDTTYTTRIDRRLIKSKYHTKTVINKQKHFINSGTNSTFLGGKSRIAIPVNLPPNTVEWYYTFSASRNETDIDNVSSGMQLASEITNLIDQTGLLNFGINQLSKPPGANYCDLYLIDYSNYNNFINKQEFSYYTSGTRENLISGTVKVENNSNQLYLGLKNPDSAHGIHVVIGIVAITKEDIYESFEVKIPRVTTKEELYIQD